MASRKRSPKVSRRRSSDVMSSRETRHWARERIGAGYTAVDCSPQAEPVAENGDIVVLAEGLHGSSGRVQS
jgi:hypothetical protein